MTPLEKQLAAKLLKAAGEIFSNHGCSDFELPTIYYADWCVMYYLASILDAEAA